MAVAAAREPGARARRTARQGKEHARFFGRRGWPASLILYLADLAQHAVGKTQRAGGGRIRLAVLCQAAADAHFLADVVEEDLPVGAVPAQRDRRVGLERPALDLAGRVLHVNEEIRMRVLPVDLREHADEVAAVVRVPFRGEGVMGCGSRGQREEHNERHAGFHGRELYGSCREREGTEGTVSQEEGRDVGERSWCCRRLVSAPSHIAAVGARGSVRSFVCGASGHGITGAVKRSPYTIAN